MPGPRQCYSTESEVQKFVFSGCSLKNSSSNQILRPVLFSAVVAFAVLFLKAYGESWGEITSLNSRLSKTSEENKSTYPVCGYNVQKYIFFCSD